MESLENIELGADCSELSLQKKAAVKDGRGEERTRLWCPFSQEMTAPLPGQSTGGEGGETGAGSVPHVSRRYLHVETH